jgi:hypothetical protein
LLVSFFEWFGNSSGQTQLVSSQAATYGTDQGHPCALRARLLSPSKNANN